MKKKYFGVNSIIKRITVYLVLNIIYYFYSIRSFNVYFNIPIYIVLLIDILLVASYFKLENDEIFFVSLIPFKKSIEIKFDDIKIIEFTHHTGRWTSQTINITTKNGRIHKMFLSAFDECIKLSETLKELGLEVKMYNFKKKNFWDRDYFTNNDEG